VYCYIGYSCPTLGLATFAGNVLSVEKWKRVRMLKTVTACLLLAATASLAGAAQGSQSSTDRATVSGVVRDSSGGAVAGAVVIARSGSRGEQQTVTGPDGRFSIDLPSENDAALIVRAGGFAENRQQVMPGSRDLEIVLMPATLLEEVTVTATRTEQRLGDIPASVSVLGGEDIKRSPAVVADDVLRQVPTFSLFRRTSSLSSHPTAQGVSLRGIGPSGVSRTLVLIDDVPFNDPFGGWVYWTRVPLENTERIEVVDGSSSSLYGNYAMGGVINIVTSHPARRTVELKPQYGNLGSPKVDFFASDVWGKLGAAVEGSVFKTDGFPIVAASERGLVDNKAAVDFGNYNVKLDYNPDSRVNAFFRTGYFRENRDNGKASTFDGTEEANNTRWKFVSGGARIVLPDQSDLQARIFTDFETFHSNFLAVPTAIPARSIGRMTLDQAVPTTGVGGMVSWGKAFARNQFFTAGADGRWVDGESQEDVLDTARGATVITKRFSGGSQQSLGAFLQDMITPVPKLQVTLSARVDHWRNYHAHNLETTVLTGLPTANNKPSCADTNGVPPTCLQDRADTVVSPRAAALYHVTDRVSAWGDFGYGFRAPTLNELYRQFSVGALLTRANDQLGPERLVGGELGLNVAPARRLTIRTTWFDNRISNPVANVTIGTNLQQRQNLGKTRVWGIQSDAEYLAGSSWRFLAGYLFNQARIVEFAANPALAVDCPGNPGEACVLPQVPAHRGSLRVVYSNPRYATVAVGFQFFGRQFDDDQNVRAVPAPALIDAGYAASADAGLPRYTVADLTVSRAVGRNADLFFGVQNLFDRQYFVGTLPTTIGSPRMANAGVRIRFMGR
jgi:outer membrane receptor protein involved in Fe transport